MDKSTRIRLIVATREALESLSWEDEQLLLAEFGVGARPETQCEETPTMTEWLRQADEQALVALAQHLEVLDPDALPDDAAETLNTSTEPGRLGVFASHLFAERRFVGAVEEALKGYGVAMFVAHDSISVDAEWLGEIADALAQCHAGAAFLHKDFNKSMFCQQEVGWMLGRHLHVAKLMFGEVPQALLSSKQGIQALGDGSAKEVSAVLMDYFASKEDLHPNLAASLVHALDSSRSFAQTDAIWTRLKSIDCLTTEQVLAVILAAEQNSQVYSAGVGGYRGEAYRLAIARFLSGQPEVDHLSERIQRLQDKAEDGLILGDDETEWPGRR